MRVLSLFDGCGGARQALKTLNITPKEYYASEIDKHAISIAKKNHPNLSEIGDINSIDYALNEINGPFDLIIGGSPCQDLSIAKKNREGLNGSRSGLFWNMASIIKTFEPKYFLVENVASMSKESKQIITNTLGVEPILINSALLTAQSRKRLYWTNIKGIVQPKDKHIYLKDIIETGYVDRDKSYCIDACYYKGTNLKHYNNKRVRQIVFTKPVRLGYYSKGGQGDRVYSTEGKSVCLSANSGGKGSKTGLYEIDNKVASAYHKPYYDKIAASNKPLIVSERGRRLTFNGVKRDDNNGKIYRGLEVCSDKKSNCLSTVQKDNLLAIKKVVRKLTPIECERLQGLPDDYTEGVSNTQRYKMLGNGFTIPVISHILSFMQ